MTIHLRNKHYCQADECDVGFDRSYRCPIAFAIMEEYGLTLGDVQVFRDHLYIRSAKQAFYFTNTIRKIIEKIDLAGFRHELNIELYKHETRINDPATI